MLQTIAGETFKLESPTGTLLGTVTIPTEWANQLRQDKVLTFALREPDISYSSWANFDPNKADLTFRTGQFLPSLRYCGGLVMFGATLEEFEQIEGCSFSPGAAYLRSIVA